MLRARAQPPTRAPSPSLSGHRRTSRDLPVTRPSRDTVSYGPGTAPSLFSTLRTRALALARAPAPTARTRLGRSRDGIVRQPMWFTPTCALLTAVSLCLMLRVQAQD